MADEALLSSTRVLPKRLLDTGFVFAHPTIGEALAASARYLAFRIFQSSGSVIFRRIVILLSCHPERSEGSAFPAIYSGQPDSID